MADIIPPVTTPIPSTPTDQPSSYLPSSVEKKRAVVMYLLIGII